MPRIGAQLREQRQRKGLTQDELAEMTGIRRTDLSKIENDRVSVGQGRLDKLAAALEIDVAELWPLLGQEGDGNDDPRLGRLEAIEAALDEVRRNQREGSRTIVEGQREALEGQAELRALLVSLQQTLDALVEAQRDQSSQRRAR